MRAIIVAFLVGLLAGLGLGWYAHKGYTTEAEEKNQSQAETDRLLRQANTVRIEKRTLVREAKDNATLTELLRRIDREIPASACPLPPAWRVLHDAAAKGEDPPATGFGDAAPVAAGVAAETVTRNYTNARKNASTLEDCQRYIREVVKPEGLDDAD